MNSSRISLSLKDGELFAESEQGELSDKLIGFLREHKQALIEALSTAGDTVQAGGHDDISRRLADIWFDITQAQPESSSNFFDLSATSMDVLQLKKKIFNEFSVDIDTLALFKAKQFEQQVTLLKQTVGCAN